MKAKTKVRHHKLHKSANVPLCAICFQKNSAHLTSDYGHEFVKCNKCGITVHRRCNGSIGINENIFTCPKCCSKSAKEKICLICTRAEGYLTKIKKKKWIHPICGLLIDSVEILNYDEMKFIETKTMIQQQAASSCDICGVSTGQLLLCAHPNCTKAVHAFCGYEVNGEGWQIDLSLGSTIDTPYPELKSYIESNYPQSEVRKTEEVDETKQKNPCLAERGGKILVYCQIHQKPPVYCICNGDKSKVRGQNKSKTWMIACDYCDNWYHGDCAGVTEKESKGLDNYICEKCNSWERAKKEYLLNESTGKIGYKEQQLIEINKWTLYPTTTNKLVDILLISQVLNIHGQALINLQCNLQQLYNHLVNQMKVPLMFSKLKEKIKEKFQAAVNIDIEVSQGIIEPSPILNIINGEYKLIEVNLHKNRKLVVCIEMYIEKYKEIKNYTKYTEQLVKAKSLLLCLEKLEQSLNTGIELNEATDCLEMLNENRLRCYAERRLLEEELSKYRAWESKVNKELLFNRMQISEKDIYSIEGEFNDKVQFIEENIRKKMDLAVISTLIKESFTNFIKNKEIVDALRDRYNKFIDANEKYKDFLKHGTTLEEFIGLIKEICEGIASSENCNTIVSSYKEFVINHINIYRILNNKATIKDITDALNNMDSTQIRPLDVIEALKKRLTDIDQWKERAEIITKEGINIEKLRDHITEGERYLVNIPELENMKKQLKTLQDIESYTQNGRSIEYEELINLMESAILCKLPESTISFLRFYLSQAQSLLQISETLLSTVDKSYESIEDIKKCINSIKESKIIIPSLSKLEQVIGAYEWLNKVLKLLNVFNITNVKYSTIEYLPQEMIEKVCKKAEEVSDSLIGPACALQRKFQHVVWKHKVQARLNIEAKLTEQEIDELIKEINKIELDTSNPLCGSLVNQIFNYYTVYNHLLSQYKRMMQVNIDELKPEELSELINRLKTLKQNAKELQIECSELINKLSRMEEYIKSYLLILKLINARESSGVDNEVFVKAFDDCIKSSEGQPKSVLLENLYPQVEKYKKWTGEYNAYKEEKEKGLRSNNFTLKTIKDLMEESLNIDFILNSDIETMKADIAKGEENERMASSYLERLSEGYSMTNINIKELSKLVESMQSIPLCSKVLLYTLKAHLWKLRAESYLNKDVPKHKLSEWETLINDQKDIQSQTDNDSYKYLLNKEVKVFINNIYKEAIILVQKVNNLRSGNLKYSKSELVILMEELSKSIIDLKDEIEYVGGLIKEFEDVKRSFKELVERRANLVEFEELKERIQRCSLSVNEIEDKLTRIINSGRELLKSFETLNADHTKTQSKINESDVEMIQKEYAKLGCSISEIDELIDKYNKSKDIITSYIQEIYDMARLTELNRITNDFNQLPIDMNISSEPLIAEICRKKYELLIEDNKEIKPGLNTLKGLLEDINNLNCLDKDGTTKLEELIERGESNIEKLKSINDLIELAKYEEVLINEPLDYTDQLIEQRIRIRLKREVKIGGKRVRPEKSIEISKKQSSSEVITQKLRMSSRIILEQAISANKEFKNGKKGISNLAQELEEELYNQTKNKTTYKDLLDGSKSNIGKFGKYPLLSAYIGKGKLALWKLLKINNPALFLKKLENIEGLLKKKGIQAKEESSKLETKKMRLSLLTEEEKMPEGNSSPVTLSPTRAFRMDLALKDNKGFPLNIKAVFSDDEEPNSPKGQTTQKPTLNPNNILIPYTCENIDTMQLSPPTGTLLRIWKGRIESGKIAFQCSMFTSDNIKKYYQAPAFIPKLKIDGRARLSDVIQYLSSNLVSMNMLILKGWILPEDNIESLNNIKKYSLELDKEDKCGVIDIKELTSHIYIIPWSDKASSFIKQCEINFIPENKVQGNPKFVYFITYKKSGAIGLYKPMRPTVIKLPPIEKEIAGMEVISDDESSEQKDNDANFIKTLREKLSGMTSEDIENLKNRLNEANREPFEKLLKEVFPERDYKPIDSPMEDIQDDIDYMEKVNRVNNFIARNRSYFLNYAMNYQMRIYPQTVKRYRSYQYK